MRTSDSTPRKGPPNHHGGFSGVRESVIDMLLALYNKGMTPVIWR
ncbi:MAG: hypothetical protein ACREXG_08565 [Polaromonas sp.]